MQRVDTNTNTVFKNLPEMRLARCHSFIYKYITGGTKEMSFTQENAQRG